MSIVNVDNQYHIYQSSNTNLLLKDFADRKAEAYYKTEEGKKAIEENNVLLRRLSLLEHGDDFKVVDPTTRPVEPSNDFEHSNSWAALVEWEKLRADLAEQVLFRIFAFERKNLSEFDDKYYRLALIVEKAKRAYKWPECLKQGD